MIPILISDKFDLLRLKDSNGKAMTDSEGRALYVPDANPTIPEHNGLGEMGDATSCIVKSTINAPDELTMTYSVTGSLYKDIKERCVIIAEPDRVRSAQPYRIYRITKPLKGIITIYARHLAHDGLSGIPVAPFTASDIQGAMAGLKANAMVNCPFTLSTTRTTAAKFSVKVPTDIWSLLGGQQGSLLDVYGGEYSFDGYNVTLGSRIGQDNGVTVRYGVNMVDLEQDKNIANCYTGVVAYWRNEDDEIHSPVMYAGGTYGYVRILPVDMSTKWESKPTVEQLKAAAVKYIKDNEIGVPKVSWKVQMVDLAGTEEYKNIALLERVSLGDTVGVEFEELGVDATARVRSIEWDVLKERYRTITLGSVKANIATTIAGQARELAQTPTRSETINIAKGLAAVAMGLKGGAARLLDTNDDGNPDEFYVGDNEDPALARYVARWNYRGLAISDNGYNGPFKLGWTPEGGFMAWMITACNIVAGFIRSESENFRINLDSGVLITTSSDTYLAADYTSADPQRVAQILSGAVTATDADLEKYDFYRDGQITTTDLAICQAIVNAGKDLTIQWSVKIDPNDRAKPVSVTMVRTGALNDSSIVFAGGLSGVRGTDARFSGTVTCNRLIVNGHEIT